MSITLNKSTESVAVLLALKYTNLDSKLKISIDEAATAPFVDVAGEKYVGALTVSQYAIFESNKTSQKKKDLLHRDSANDSCNVIQLVNLAREIPTLDSQQLPLVLKKILNRGLRLNTYFVGNDISLADLFLYAFLHPIISKFDAQQKQTYLRLCRWFNAMQVHAPWGNGVTKTADSTFAAIDLPFVDLALESIRTPFKFVPFVVQQPAAPKPAAAAAAQQGAPKPAEGAKKEEKGKQQPAQQPAAKEEKKPAEGAKKETKKEAKKEEKKPAAEAATTVAPEDANPTVFDIRVGKILKVEKHPNADSLFVEEIDVGEEKPRIVCSGLVNKIEQKDLENAVLAVMCNLKPTSMRGITSYAMVLASTDAETQKVELVKIPEGAKIGERLTFTNYTGEPVAQVNPKQLPDLLKHFKTNGEGQVVYKENDSFLKASSGTLYSNFKNAVVK